MTNAQKNSGVGDKIARSLRQPAGKIEQAAASNLAVPVETVPTPVQASHAKSLAASLKQCSSASNAPGNCAQTVWFSFFFDGTGNNLDADVESLKHSNVAKLYRAHKGDENNGGVGPRINKYPGTYRIYVPGIGTYFRAKGDPGGSDAGLGAGAFGDARLAWALAEFESKMAWHIALANNPGNQILAVNIAAFGFSRGAALARAFIHDFIEDQCKLVSDEKWILKSAKCPIKIRFLGLFDTVASVGLAMSANNMEKIDAIKGNVLTHISTRLAVHHETRPTVLAFHPQGAPGADPAPGQYNGHAQWGDKMLIPEMVDDVRHFVAGHEIRNSFPSDSISVMGKAGGFRMPKKFHEYVYPGVHSDVGGSYRPGEGGKNEKPDTKLGLIPLREMYDFAMAAGVPFLPETAWEEYNHQDFVISPKVIKDFRYYFSRFERPAHTLGEAFNAHMKLYYAWRFHVIAKKRAGDRSEAERITKNEIQFKKERDALEKKIAGLQGKHNTSLASVTSTTWKRDDYVELNESGPERAEILSRLNKDLAVATLAEKEAKHQLLLEKAKLLALPKTSELPGIIEIYDKQLMLDAQAILEIIDNPKLSTYQRKFATGLSTLRPHYKIILEAYRAEFLEKKGLKDERIIAFFDSYVHDSLAGFGKDGTLPSDPRVVYVGGDEKLKHAGLGGTEEMHSVEHLT
jgi:hypothetical protein